MPPSYENVKNIVFFRDTAREHFRRGNSTSVEKRSWSAYTARVNSEKRKEECFDSEVLDTLSQHDDLAKTFVTQAFSYGCIVKHRADCEQDESTDTSLWDAFGSWDFTGQSLQGELFRITEERNQNGVGSWVVEKTTVLERLVFLTA